MSNVHSSSVRKLRLLLLYLKPLRAYYDLATTVLQTVWEPFDWPRRNDDRICRDLCEVQSSSQSPIERASPVPKVPTTNNNARRTKNEERDLSLREFAASAAAASCCIKRIEYPNEQRATSSLLSMSHGHLVISLFSCPGSPDGRRSLSDAVLTKPSTATIFTVKRGVSLGLRKCCSHLMVSLCGDITLGYRHVESSSRTPERPHQPSGLFPHFRADECARSKSEPDHAENPRLPLPVALLDHRVVEYSSCEPSILLSFV